MERARLVATDPTDRPREFALSNSDVAVGSDRANDIVLTGAGISRRHAVLRLRDGRYFLDDLDSSNGSFVNGNRVHGPTALSDGDRVRFAGAAFVFRDPRALAGKRRRSASRTVASLLLMFAAGFAIAAGLLNRDWLRRTIERVARGSRPAASATARAAGGELAANPVGSPAAALLSSPAPSEEATREPQWLARMNYFRAMADLPAVSEDPLLSKGDFNHARYMVKNNAQPNASAHDEDPDNPWYTPEGRAAAQDGDLIPPCSGCPELSGAGAIDLWMVGPFHRILLLNPVLRHVGFGEFHEDSRNAYGINLGMAPKRTFDTPIMFPPQGATVELGPLIEEWPDPIASCTGYGPPAGLPITLELGPGIVPEVSAYSLTEDEQPVEACEFDQTNYANPDREQEDWARKGLKYFGAIVLVPRAPLVAGRNYSASITVGGQAYAWSFKFGADSPP
jgi:uncharacterized protein YkwD